MRHYLLSLLLAGPLCALLGSTVSAQETKPTTPSPPPPPASAPPAEKSFDDRVFYKDGKLNFALKGGSVQIGNRLQGRFTYSDPEVGEEVGSFRIRRMKTTIEGSLANSPWRFKLQANWVGTDTVTNVSQTGGGSVTQTRRRGPVLEDAELWYTKYPFATVWLGQGKSYFGRQDLVSSARLLFVDRAITSDRFTPFRQVGVGLVGVNKSKTFEYNLGFYNGGADNAVNTTVNDNNKYMKIARVAWTPFGELKYDESGFEYPASPKLLIGVAVLEDTRGTGANETALTRFGYELALKYRGLGLQGEYFSEEADRRGSSPVNADGYYVQVSYLLPGNKVELAGRLAEVLPDSTAPQDRTETGVAASWYLDKHNRKLQADYRQIEDDRTRNQDRELRLQLQLVF